MNLRQLISRALFVRAGFVVVVVLGVTAIAISWDGLHDRIGKADVGVVLGTKVERDGKPSPAMRARLDEAIRLYRQGYFRTVLVSGGFGKEGFDEATVMKRYLVARQIPEAAIVVDSHGDTTEATAQNSARWMLEHHASSALVVSQYYHLSRTRLAFERCGVAKVYSAHGRLFLWRDVYAVPRDVVGYYSYWAFDHCRTRVG